MCSVLRVRSSCTSAVIEANTRTTLSVEYTRSYPGTNVGQHSIDIRTGLIYKKYKIIGEQLSRHPQQRFVFEKLTVPLLGKTFGSCFHEPCTVNYVCLL